VVNHGLDLRKTHCDDVRESQSLMEPITSQASIRASLNSAGPLKLFSATCFVIDVLSRVAPYFRAVTGAVLVSAPGKGAKVLLPARQTSTLILILKTSRCVGLKSLNPLILRTVEFCSLRREQNSDLGMI